MNPWVIDECCGQTCGVDELGKWVIAGGRVVKCARSRGGLGGWINRINWIIVCVFRHSERIGVDNADNSGYVSWIILIILAYPVATLENPTIYPIILIIRGWAGARGFIQGGVGTRGGAQDHGDGCVGG